MDAARDKPTLIHLADSASASVLWLVEELDIDYNLQIFDREQHRAPPELKETHPQGKSPQLVLSDGRVLTQLSAILLYILRTYDKEHRFHHPNDDFIREEQLVCIGIADLSSKITSKLMFHGLAVQGPFFLRPLLRSIYASISQLMLDADIEAIFMVLENELENREWFMGGMAPSRADFALHFAVEVTTQSHYADIDAYPRLKAWTARCKARDAWKRSADKVNGHHLDFPGKW